MFADAKAFNSDLSSWDGKLGNVRTAYGVFLGATSFTSDLLSWKFDTDYATDFSEMFLGATSFPSDLSGWDVSTVVWKGRIDELCTHVRPLFRQLIVTAHSANMKIAIVTFSPQVNHIIEVLETHFPSFASEILIRGRDHSWAYEGNGMKAGKQPFMASAAEEFEEKYPNIEITRNTTLLVDDDANNIRLALKDGVRAIWFNPNG